MSETAQSVDADARRLALEIIATLINIKRIAAERLLTPSGVPADLVRRFINERDPSTGEKRTKREAGAVVLESLREFEDEAAVVRRIVECAAVWQDFHLAQDEFRARSVAQKAREMLGVMHDLEARERAEAAERQAASERARVAKADRQRRERNDLIRQQSPLLLAQFDGAVVGGAPQSRGYMLENLLNRTFDLHGIPATRSFRRNEGGEQIDGAFELEGWHHIVECRWRERLADIHQLDALSGKIGRSGRQTMGLFLSINGWSSHVVDLLKQNPDKNIILVDGVDLRAVLSAHIALAALLRAKFSALNLYAEPFKSVSALLG